MIWMRFFTIFIFIFIIIKPFIFETTCNAQRILENMLQSFESRRMIENKIPDENQPNIKKNSQEQKTMQEMEFTAGLLTEETFNKLPMASQLDLQVIKANPSLLELKHVMQYFIILNELHHPTKHGIKSLNNEFDYPKFAEFYRKNANKVFDIMPNIITVILSGNHKIYLGEYDFTNKAFPFLDLYGNPQTISIKKIDLIKGESRVIGDREIGVIYPQAFNDIAYSIHFDELSFNKFPLQENMAREIISKLIGPSARRVGLQFEIEIVNVPKLKTVNKSGFFIADVKNVIIAGKVIKVNVLRDPGHELLGILFEESSTR